MCQRTKRENETSGDVLRSDAGAAWRGWCAGVRRAHPEQAGVGGVLYEPAGRAVAAFSEAIGHRTTEVASWAALNLIINTAAECSAEALAVFMDSELIVGQINDTYEVRNEQVAALINLVQVAVERLRGHVDIHCTEQSGAKEARGRWPAAPPRYPGCMRRKGASLPSHGHRLFCATPLNGLTIPLRVSSDTTNRTLAGCGLPAGVVRIASMGTESCTMWLPKNGENNR